MSAIVYGWIACVPDLLPDRCVWFSALRASRQRGAVDVGVDAAAVNASVNGFVFAFSTTEGFDVVYKRRQEKSNQCEDERD